MSSYRIFNTFEKVSSSGVPHTELINKLDIKSGGSIYANGVALIDYLGKITVGAFSSTTAGSGIALSSSVTKALAVYGDDAGAAMTGSIRTILGRTLLTVDQTGDMSPRGVMGQLKLKNGVDLTNGIASGVEGYLELAGTNNFAANSFTAAVTGVVELTTASTITTGGYLAGIASIYKSTATPTGNCAAFITKIGSTAKWPKGLYIPAASATTGILVGDYAASYASGSAMVFSASNTGIVKIYGESTSDLTSAYNCRTIVGRHLVVCASDTVINHETYGIIGQLCVKYGSLNHYHGGVMGTVECDTDMDIQTSYGVGAVVARTGGATATIESGGLLAGFLAVQNMTAYTATGTMAAFATKKTAAGAVWPIGLYMASGDVTTAIDVTCAAIGASGRIAKLYGSCAAGNMGDGYGAVEIDLTLSGTVAGMVAASSTWVEVTGASVTAGSQTVCVRNDGIYVTATGTPMASATAIIGGRLQYVAAGGGNPGALYLWQTNISDNALTAMFSVNALVDLGGSDGAASSGAHKIPFVKIGSTVYYVNMYTS